MSLKEKRAKKFLKLRNRALTNLDVKLARRLANYSKKINDETILIALHKSRYEATDLPAKLRLESRDWLKAKNLSRMVPEDFLPGDELPE